MIERHQSCVYPAIARLHQSFIVHPEPYTADKKRIPLNDLFFPVELHSLFWEKDGQHEVCDAIIDHYECPRHYAVVRMDMLHTFTTVTEGYVLVQNKDAIKLGQKVAAYVFHHNDDMPLITEVRDLTSYGSACEVSIQREVEKGQPLLLNGWQAIVRVGNSYNKTKQLSYNVGFEYNQLTLGQKTGLLIPSLGIEVKNAHSISFRKVEEQVWKKIRQSEEGTLIQRMEEEFVRLISGLNNIRLSHENMLRLFCKVYKLKKSEKNRANNFMCLRTVENILTHFDNVDNTAYKMLLVFAEYISAAYFPNYIHRDLGHDQLELGRWAQQFVEETSKPNFSISKFFGDDINNLVSDYLSLK